VGKEGVAPMRHRHERADGGAERLLAVMYVALAGAFACDGFIRDLSTAQPHSTARQRAAQLGIAQ
jgi:hypothetical protein